MLEEKASRVTASAFLEDLIETVPYKIHTILTDHGIQFAFPPRYKDGPTARYVTTCSTCAARKTASSTASQSRTIHGPTDRSSA